jgi:hypothetical protein
MGRERHVKVFKNGRNQALLGSARHRHRKRPLITKR